MTLNYPQKQNGMYILKRENFDNIAENVLKEYLPTTLEWPQPLDIEYLASECLFLEVKHMYLSSNGGILGMVTFADTPVEGLLDATFQLVDTTIPMATVLIDMSLIGKENKARWRYTLAHECSHWICHRSYHSPDNRTYNFRRGLVACRADNIERNQMVKSPISSDYSWEEWQADGLAAALLMPKEMFKEAFYSEMKKVGLRQGYLVKGENETKAYCVIRGLMDVFKVSNKATQIRLLQLGLIVK